MGILLEKFHFICIQLFFDHFFFSYVDLCFVYLYLILFLMFIDLCALFLLRAREDFDQNFF